MHADWNDAADVPFSVYDPVEMSTSIVYMCTNSRNASRYTLRAGGDHGPLSAIHPSTEWRN